MSKIDFGQGDTGINVALIGEKFLQKQSRVENLNLFSAVAPSGATTTGDAVNVARSIQNTIIWDLTGNATAQSVVTVQGRHDISSTGWINIHVNTATVNTSYAFIVGTETGAAYHSTGCIVGFTGIKRWDELRLTIVVSGTLTNTNPTLVARVLTE